jgi:hypothetical protein
LRDLHVEDALTRFGVEDALTRFWCGRRVLALLPGNDEK